MYGSAAIRDAATQGAYAAVAGPGQTAHNMAVADFFNAPDISEINLARYTGQPGSTISLKATDLPGNDTLVKKTLYEQHDTCSPCRKRGFLLGAGGTGKAFIIFFIASWF